MAEIKLRYLNREYILNRTAEIEKLIEEIDEIRSKIDGYTDVFVCGGASIYKQMINYCDECLVTHIDATTEDADTFFPNLNELDGWHKKECLLDTFDDKSQLHIEIWRYVKGI